MFLTLIHVKPWGLAAILCTAASILNGLSSVEIRRRAYLPYAYAALVLAETAEFLCIPSMSPALVTCISGFGMIIVISYCDPDKPLWKTRIASGLITVSVIVIALDLHINGRKEYTEPETTSQTLFWALTALSSFISAICSAHTSFRICRYFLMFGTGIQAVISITLTYGIMTTGNIALLPILIVNAGFEMFLITHSLKVNAVSHHLPISYATWQIGVWASAPAVESVTYHGTAATTLGMTVAIGASIFIMFNTDSNKLD